VGGGSPLSGDAEQQRLDGIAAWFSIGGFNTTLIRLGLRTISPHFVPGSLLEVGCASGEMTRLLLDFDPDLSVLDGAPAYVEAARALSPRIQGEVSLIEDWSPDRGYDNIILAHVLEHVVDPVGVLRRLATGFTERGRLFVIVPNAHSLHRLAGVQMGLIESPTQLTDQDRSVGHRRVYTSEALAGDIRRAGLRCPASGGIFLKPLANQQIEEQWSPELVEAYYQLGLLFPDHCGELYAVCERESS
jgi:trans-aconitate methyltransferase